MRNLERHVLQGPKVAGGRVSFRSSSRTKQTANSVHRLCGDIFEKGSLISLSQEEALGYVPSFNCHRHCWIESVKVPSALVKHQSPATNRMKVMIHAMIAGWVWACSVPKRLDR